MNNTTKYIIEVRRSAEAKNKKFFKAHAPREHARIRLVTDSKFAKNFETQAEAEEVCEFLRDGYLLNFTVVEKGV